MLFRKRLIKHMPMLKGLGYVCLLILPHWAGAQNGGNNNYIPPAPNAAALLKFVDLPVNTHTGVPQVSVPIYQWKNRISDLSLDVSLSYHAGGVKVEEMASNIGLGWSLNAGGVISRTMRGLPDELDNGFLRTPVLPDIETKEYNGGRVLYPSYNPLYSLGVAHPNFVLATDIKENNLDGQQDIFYYNFNGRSGKFFIGKDGSILMQTLDNIKIIPKQVGNDRLSSFDIIDDSGVLYSFRDSEVTFSTSRSQGQNGVEGRSRTATYNSSWYLTEIKSADRQHSITFEYENAKQIYNTGYGEFKSVNLTSNPTIPNGGTYQIRDWANSYNQISVDARSLKKINLPDGNSVDFTYNTFKRLDLQTDYALKKISVKNGMDSFGFDLVQSYFNSDVNGGILDDYKRLRLDQLIKFGAGQTENPYQFFYNTTTSLPARSSKNQDIWGYTIGSKRIISTRLSQIEMDEFSGTFNPFAPFLDGADHSPDSIAVKAGALEKIIYPTGGRTEYEMESNDAYDDYNYFNFRKIYQLASINKEGTNLPYDANLNGVIDGKVSFRISLNETWRQPNDPNQPVEWREDKLEKTPVSIVLKNAAGTWSKVVYNGTYLDVRSIPPIIVKDVVIPGPGTYSVTFTMDTNYPIAYDMNIDVAHLTKPSHKLAGGLRVKRITSYLSKSDIVPVSIKSFNYLDSNQISSGKLGTVPYFGSYPTFVIFFTSQQNNPIITLDVGNRSSESTQPLGAVQGSPVGYSKVTVTELNSSNVAANGKAVYRFSPLNYIGYSPVYPFRNGEYISWGAGLPLKEETYDAQGHLLKSVESNYDITIDESKSEQYRSLKIGTVLSDSRDLSMYNQYVIASSYPILGISLKQQQKERIYQGSNYAEVTSNYAYEPVKHQLTQVEKTTSKGTTTSKMFYPYQYTGVPIFQAMTNDNRIAEPVKQEQWETVNGIPLLVGASATEYALFNSFARPSKTHVLKTAEPLSTIVVGGLDATQLLTPIGYFESRTINNAYNAKGSPLSISMDKGPKEAFMWTTDGLRVKAHFRVAGEDEVYHENFEDNGNTTTSHTGNKGYSGSFTPVFTVSNSKPYVISYWYLSGSKWMYSGEQAYSGQALNGTIDDVSIYPKGAQVSSYTYHPLFGLTSQIDAKGLTAYFEYDVFGRLLYVRDREGNIIKKNDYHYRP